MKATRDSWKAEPMPGQKTSLPFQRTYTEQEYQHLILGLNPEEMEDKWFVFEEGGWLHFHRSWTGFCIYRVHCEKAAAGYTTTETWVNRDPEQYSETDDAFDAALLQFLIETLLLGNPCPFPRKAGVSEDQQALFQWSSVGRQRDNQGNDIYGDH